MHMTQCQSTLPALKIDQTESLARLTGLVTLASCSSYISPRACRTPSNLLSWLLICNGALGLCRQVS